MNTEHSHPTIHPATVDRSNPAAPKRRFAKSIVSNSLRQRVSVALGLCLGLAALVIAFE
jgi:S-adenosylmethionine synthetase